MEDLSFEIPVMEGYEIDLDKSDLEQGVIKFKEAKQGLVKSWEDLVKVKGYLVDEDSCVTNIFLKWCGYRTEEKNRNTWATKEQAEASIAMAMLSQLMKQANGDWTPDWNDSNTIKHVIYFYKDTVLDSIFSTANEFLAFKSKEIRDEFLELHRDLIEKAKPLL